MKRMYALLFINVIIISGCSGTLFSAYPKKINPMIAGLQTGKPLNLDLCLVDECKGGDRILYNMERGRVAHILGNIDASMRDFSFSMTSIKFDDEKALISASALAENLGAVLINDNAISYTGEGYERVMLYHYQALNFLRMKDLEGAGVEVRRANSEQEESLKRFEHELEDAQRAAVIRQINEKSRSVVTLQYAQLDEVAGRVKNSFQNAYTFYISGFIYELLNLNNDAYIDYKKALEIYPENRFLQKDVIRLASVLDMGEDLDALRERFGIESLATNADDGDSGELLILFEDGFAPQKQEVRITLPIPDAGLVSLAFPMYRERWAPQFPVSIAANGDILGTTEPICDIRALAVKALKEKAPLIAVRQIIRALAKGASAHAAKKQYGDMGAIGMSIVNIATEHADLRSWLTLPANVQIFRASLPAGKHEITIHHARGGSVTTAVDIPQKGKTLLQVVNTGKRFYTYATAFASPVLSTTN